jgi:hypothetical protein
MRKARVLLWLLVVIGGFGLMLNSHLRTRRAQDASRWGGGVMYVAEDELPGDATRLGGRRVMVRFLPLGAEGKALARVLGGSGGRSKRAIVRNLQEKVLLLGDFDEAFTEDLLQSGRLPAPGRRELLAGHDVRHQQELTLEDQTFRVVGTLRAEESLFSKAYLIRDDADHRKLFDPADEPVEEAVILSRTEKARIRSQLADAFPKQRFTAVGWPLRLGRGAYYLYVLGTLGMLLGGSALIIGIFMSCSEKARGRWLAPPLAEIRQRLRLFCAVHVIYFGLCLVGMLIIYEFPDFQNAMLVMAGKEVESGSGLLGTAGRAYESRNIALAAVTTLGINFLFGSFASITLPSAILPGVGVLVAFCRALLWGILLAPTSLALSGRMLPHCWTLLFEGEAYIVAVFFALLIPIDLFRREAGATIPARYGRAIMLNLKGCLLVFLVLAMAAVYEASEVILIVMPPG